MLEGFFEVKSRRVSRPRIDKTGRLSIPLGVLHRMGVESVSGNYCRLYYNPKKKIILAKVVETSGDGEYRLIPKRGSGLELNCHKVFVEYGLHYSEGEVEVSYEKDLNAFAIDIGPVIQERAGIAIRDVEAIAAAS